MSAWGLYVHIPFCSRRCPYCAFAVLTGRKEYYRRYVDAVCKEIEFHGHLGGRGPLDTVFFGGGTPSILEPDLLERILDTAARVLDLAPTAEITIEANPDTADRARFGGFRRIGFNRLSLGVQSFVDETLERLGRSHGGAEAERAYRVAREAGFDNVSLDLIFSTPGTSLGHWGHSLDKAVDLDPEHISTYALSIEPDTPFARLRRRGRLPLVDEDEDARAYEWTMERLIGSGYEHYEISNFARPGRRSRHNWGYWTGGEYLGVGMSAHSFVGGIRSWNHRGLDRYLEAVEAGGQARHGQEEIGADTAARERIWMGLRTDAGISVKAGEKSSLEGQARFGELLEAGYLEMDVGVLRLTRRGFPLADALGLELVDLLEKTATHGQTVSH